MSRFFGHLREVGDVRDLRGPEKRDAFVARLLGAHEQDLVEVPLAQASMRPTA